MMRRVILVAALAVCFLGLLLALRPMLQRPVLATLAGPSQANAEATRLAAAPIQPRAFYGRALEPVDTILHGAGQSDRASFDRYSSATRTHPRLFMTYVDLRDDLPAAFARLRSDLDHFDTQEHETLPQIGLSLNRGNATAHYEAETANGADDAAVAQFCDGLRSLHRPAYVRMGYEFNGVWNGYQPATYVAAFRRIAYALHRCGNVATVWNWSPDAELDAQAAGYSAATFPDRLREFYPGDDAVDWWALNLFTPQGITAAATHVFLQEAADSKHPVMIAESSPKGFNTTDAAVRDAWFAPYFGLLRAHPNIKAFCYIDWNWAAYPQWADWGDGRIEQSPDLLGWYRQQLATLPLTNAPRTAGPH